MLRDNRTMRILFMGTPQFAVFSLQALIEHAEFCKVVGVVTQPDAPAGRGKSLTASPIKQLAMQHGLPVLQPESLKPTDAVAQLAALKPDLIVVAAFGQILRGNVLELPGLGCIKVHASLLPRWRGASPISAAIAAGDAESGITIMKMDAGLDSGPMLAHAREAMRFDDTPGTLTARLAALGARLLMETLPAYVRGEIAPQAQDVTGVTTCRTLKKEAGRLDFARAAIELERHVRAMQPWPGAFAQWQGRLLKISAARVSAQPSDAAPGTVIALGRQVGIACAADSVLELVTVQPEGRKPMPAADFARGAHGFVGSRIVPLPTP